MYNFIGKVVVRSLPKPIIGMNVMIILDVECFL